MDASARRWRQAAALTISGFVVLIAFILAELLEPPRLIERTFGVLRLVGLGLAFLGILLWTRQDSKQKLPETLQSKQLQRTSDRWLAAAVLVPFLEFGQR